MTTDIQQFTVTVDGVGSFTFAKRTMRQEMRIAAEYSRLTEGLDKPSPWFDFIAGVIACLKVLMLDGPDEWKNLDELDPSDDEVYSKLVAIHGALRLKEGSFRRGSQSGGTQGGAGDGAVGGVLVSAAVQPPAN